MAAFEIIPIGDGYGICDCRPVPSPFARAARIEALEGALRKAEQFIVNGVELGYIRLPTPPDPALDTLPAIRAALSGGSDG